MALAQARKTHCRYGHPFTDENTFRPPSGGRKCKTCIADRAKRRRELKRVVSREEELARLVAEQEREMARADDAEGERTHDHRATSIGPARLISLDTAFADSGKSYHDTVGYEDPGLQSVIEEAA